MRRLGSVLAAALAAGVATIALGTPAAVASSTGLPNDPQASGYIGLCDETGHNVTGGDIDTTPFIWKAVSSEPAPASYQGTGQDAVLDIFQPRPGTQPGDWSGGALTASSFYTDKAHPVAQATYGDQSLESFIQQYPPEVNGLYVLRMGYGKRNVGTYYTTYPTTVIQVVGKKWSVVTGGTVDCGSSKAISFEQMTGAVTKKQFTARATAPQGQTIAAASTGKAGGSTITKAPVANASAAAKSSAAGASSSAAAAGAADGGGTAGQPAAQASHTGDSSSSGWVWFIIVPAVVVLVLALLIWRRRSTGNPPAAG